MKTKDKLKLMGQIVTVNSLLVPVEDSHRFRCWITQPCGEFAGWIVGFTVRQCGNYIAASGYYDDYEPPSFNVKSVVPCVLVSRWLNSKHVPVPLDGFTLGGTPKPPVCQWTDREREEHRKAMAGWPRVNGRFAKFVRTATTH